MSEHSLRTLQETLARLSEHQPPTDARRALAQVRRGPRRRRAFVWAGATTAVTGVVVAVLVAWNDDGATVVATQSAVPASGGAREVAALTHDPDFRVYLRRDATEAEVDGVRSVLSASVDVAEFTYLDHDEAYAEFVALFADDNPQLVEFTEPDALPTSFRVILVDGASRDEFETAMRRVRVVFDVDPDSSRADISPGSAVPTVSTAPAPGLAATAGSPTTVHTTATMNVEPQPVYEATLGAFRVRISYVPGHLTRVPPHRSTSADPLGRVSETIAFTGTDELRTTHSIYVGTLVGSGVGTNIEASGTDDGRAPDELIRPPVRSDLMVPSGATVWETVDPIHGAQRRVYWAVSPDASFAVLVPVDLDRAELERVLSGVEVVPVT